MPQPSTVSEEIWELKYRFRTLDGTPVDNAISDSWRRVANAVAAPEADPETWAARFYDILDDFQFLPAGRILAGAGTERAVTLFNCFVMGTIPDDMGGIFDQLREAALTLQQGGGIGYDFSTIRPRGAPVYGVGADASGPLSFMDVWDSMCRTIMSAGARRGAMMATMRCDHPDIEAFIDAKRDPSRLRMFNLSVLASDPFMDAVRDDQPWALRFGDRIYKEIPARDLWDRIMRATYDCAEPGVVFVDRINQLNNLWYMEEISATNPCGEQPLPPYGACLLGSVNLARLILDPFSERATLDGDRLDGLVHTAVRMMDNVIDISRFPLPAQQAEAKAKRRIGLGVTGLADALLLLGVRYGSPEAVRLTEDWLRRIRSAAYRASVGLAAEKGPFPGFDRDRFCAGETIRSLEPDLQAAIARLGIRNALLTSIAPTGTISLVADNVSSGIEPVFAFTYDRTVLMPDGSRRQQTVFDSAYRQFRDRFGPDAPLPDSFVDAQSLTPEEHVVMQAAAQKYVDSSISKTINCPPSLSFEAFKDVYLLAYRAGCKGCTTFRPNEISGAVLSVRTEVTPPAAEPAGTPVEDTPRVETPPANGPAENEAAENGPAAIGPVANGEATNGQADKVPIAEVPPATAPAADVPVTFVPAAGPGDAPAAASVSAAPPSVAPASAAPTPDPIVVTAVPPKASKSATITTVPPSVPPPPPFPAALEDSGTNLSGSPSLARPEVLPGATYKVRWPANDHAIYITLNDTIHEGRRRPFEVFINSKNMEHYAWTVALTLMISAVFRRGGDVSFVVEELKAVFDPRGGQWVQGRYVPSLLAAIGEVIERHMIAIGFLADRPNPPAPDLGAEPAAVSVSVSGAGAGPEPVKKPMAESTPLGRVRHCPKCGAPGLIRQEGCDLCRSCGYSKCV